MDQITIPSEDWVTFQERLEKLQENEELYRIALSLTKQTIMVIDIPDRTLHSIHHENGATEVSNSMKDIPESIIATGIIHEDDRELYRQFFRGVYEGTPINECTMRVKADKKGWVWHTLRARTIFDEAGEPLKAIAVSDDITGRKIEEQRLRSEAELDPLCGLYNRKAFEGKVNNVLKNDRRTSNGHLFMIDVDNFKEINDAYGHVFGDEIIQSVASTLQHCFREEDILGRVGGDEFMAFMGNITSEQGKRRAVEIGERLGEMEYSQILERPVTLSIGIAEAGEYDGFASLYNKADKALYHAKSNGKGCWSIYD